MVAYVYIHIYIYIYLYFIFFFVCVCVCMSGWVCVGVSVFVCVGALFGPFLFRQFLSEKFRFGTVASTLRSHQGPSTAPALHAEATIISAAF